MPKIIPHSKPTLDSSDLKALAESLESGQIAQGRLVKEFKNDFAEFLKIKYASAVNSGTSALHLALLALGIKKGDEVIIPTFVCTALLNAVSYVQAKNVLADVNYDDFNISEVSIKEKITKNTKAIIVPHMFGAPADLKPILSIGIPVIEDCAQAVGAIYRGRQVGSFGQLNVFSFYATKVMTTAEGGMVVSNDKNLIEKIKDLREYDKKENFRVRYNYKMTDLQAALGISQLIKLPKMIKRRREIAGIYNEAFKDSPFEIPKEKPNCQNIFYRYIIKSEKFSSEIIKQLNKNGINCAHPISKPLHQYLKFKPKDFPIAEECMDKSFSLPIYPNLKNDEIKYIIKEVLKIY